MNAALEVHTNEDRDWIKFLASISNDDDPPPVVQTRRSEDHLFAEIAAQHALNFGELSTGNIIHKLTLAAMDGYLAGLAFARNLK